MFRFRLAIATLGFVMIVPAVPALQEPATEAPAAPVPSQILTAKKVFISNNGGGLDSQVWSGGPARTYNEFYAAIKNWGRYELVAAPADADLVMEISSSSEISGVGGSKESGCRSSNSMQFKLVLLDPRTRIVLWTVTETVEGFILRSTGEKNTVSAMKRLIGDLKSLASQPTAAAK